MDRTGKITLGGTEFTVGPLTLGQMRKIGVGSVAMNPKNNAGKPASEQEDAWYANTFAVIAAALNKKPEEVEALPNVTFDELIAANQAIYKVTGLVKDKPEASPVGDKGEEPATG